MFHSDVRTSSNSVGDFSGLICSVDPAGHGFAAKYGYFEAKIWLPPVTAGSPPNAQGLWPAFWLLDQGNIFPNAYSEIDIMEGYSVDYTKYHVNIHNYNGATAPTDATHPNRFTTVQAASDLSTGWHIFSCLVTPTLIHAYLDGVEVFNCLSGSGDQGFMYILANFAEGGGWPDQQNWGTDPGNNQPWTNTTNMKIQYIRVWAQPGNITSLPSSLYYADGVKPSWWPETLPFPAIGPDCSPENGMIPAQQRYMSEYQLYQH